MNSTLVLTLIVLIASILQAGTGFGFAIIALPFLILIFPAHEAIQLNIILCTFISILMTYKTRNKVNKEILKRLISGSLIGILPGLIIFIFLDVKLLKILVSILILVSTGLLITKVTLKQSNKKEYITGSLSGLLTCSIGMPGPPLMIYFSGAKIDKAILRSTTMAYFIFICSISLIFQMAISSLSKNILLSILWSMPFMLFGIYLGERLYTRLNQQLFYKIIYLLLIFTGTYSLITNIV